MPPSSQTQRGTAEVAGGTATITQTTFHDNGGTTVEGGALDIYLYTTVAVDACSFYNNSASEGGGNKCVRHQMVANCCKRAKSTARHS